MGQCFLDLQQANIGVLVLAASMAISYLRIRRRALAEEADFMKSFEAGLANGVEYSASLTAYYEKCKRGRNRWFA